MYSSLIVFAGFSLAGLVMSARAARTAPDGYQDANGFHALNPGEPVASTTVEPAFGLDDLLLPDKRLASQPWC